MKLRRFMLSGCVIAAGVSLMLWATARPARHPHQTAGQFAQKPQAARTHPAAPAQTAASHPQNPPATPATEKDSRQLPVDQLIAHAYKLAKTDPEQSLMLAMKVPASNRAANPLVSHAAAQWVAIDPVAASAWAEHLEDDALRDRVAVSIATAWSETAPAEAAQWALKVLPAGRAQDDALVSIVQRWTQQQPAVAAEWVWQFPEGALRKTALENLVTVWAYQSQEQAGQWISHLSGGTGRDTAVAAYVSFISPENPELAIQWASSIEDAALRQKSLADCAQAGS